MSDLEAGQSGEDDRGSDERRSGLARSAPARSALVRFENALGAPFKDVTLLEDALRHSSFAHEEQMRSDSVLDNNERLEFLGDSVLGLAVADALYRAHPDWREGELSRALHALVEGRSLTRLAQRFELGPLIRLGRTEEQSGGMEKPSILADAMEAVIGAIFLDRGLEAVMRFVEHAFGEALEADAPIVERDPKTEFQEQVMAVVGEFPSYRVVEDNQIEGDDQRFTVEVCVQQAALARGIGRTKRAAERLAARDALAGWPPDSASGD